MTIKLVLCFINWLLKRFMTWWKIWVNVLYLGKILRSIWLKMYLKYVFWYTNFHASTNSKNVLWSHTISFRNLRFALGCFFYIRFFVKVLLLADYFNFRSNVKVKRQTPRRSNLSHTILYKKITCMLSCTCMYSDYSEFISTRFI